MRISVYKFQKQSMWRFWCECYVLKPVSPVGLLLFCWLIDSLLYPMFSHCREHTCIYVHVHVHVYVYVYICILYDFLLLLFMCLSVILYWKVRAQFVYSTYDSYRYLWESSHKAGQNAGLTKLVTPALLINKPLMSILKFPQNINKSWKSIHLLIFTTL